MLSKELHLGQTTGAGGRAGNRFTETPETMSTKKRNAPKPTKNPPVVKAKPEIKKPVIAFYKNAEKSRWVLFPQICHNEKIAKQRIHTMTGSEKVKCLDVPEDLQNL